MYTTMQTPTHSGKATAAIAEGLWEAHRSDPSDATRNALMEHYLPIVKFAALRLASKNGRRAKAGDADDLMQYGVFGLRDAIRGFDASRGFKFETYCLQRIRGAMLDGLKAGNWVPRDIRQNMARFNTARERMEAQYGPGLHAHATAESLGVSEEEVHQLDGHVMRTSLTSLSTADESHEAPADGRIADHREEPADEVLQRKDVRDLFMRELNRTERQLMIMYYYENMTMREVGDVLGISGTRVSQIHTDVVKRLRERLSGRVTDDAGKSLEPLCI